MKMQPTEEQLAIINSKFAREPLQAEQVYVFPNKVIGDKKIDKYNCRVSPNFLRKMSQQLKEGVALLIDHPWTKWEALSIPYGKSFDSWVQTDGDELAVYANHYMKMGLEFEGIKTDSLAAAIDSGTISETSAGYATTVCLCSICGESYWSGSCPHVNRRVYEIDGKEVECELIQEDGYIMEDSLVFAGAYDGAGIPLRNAQSKSSDAPELYVPWDLANKTPPPDGKLYCTFSSVGGMNIFISAANERSGNDALSSLSATTQTKEEDEQMKDNENATTALAAASNLLTQIRSALNIQADTDIMGAIQALTAKGKLADDYKNELIEAACGSGVRALGEAFNVELMKTSLSSLPIDQIKAVQKQYETHAQALFGGGGKKTQTTALGLPDDPNANPQAEVGEESDEEYALAAQLAAKRARGEE